MPDNVRLDEYISGGYYIVKAMPRPDWKSADLLPAKIISASGDMCPSIPDAWAIRWTDRTQASRLEDAAMFGLSPDELELLLAWTDEAWSDNRLRWTNVLSTPEVARDVATRFVAGGLDVHILGISVRREHAAHFPAVPDEQVDECESGGCRKNGLPGVYETLALGEPPAEGGRRLGFELLGFMMDAPPPFSWLANDLEAPVADELRIRPSVDGFIATEADARKAADYCNRDDVPSEPVHWLPWLIVEYDLA